MDKTMATSKIAANYPTVSVIIPCFNCGAFLDDAVDSVLEQTYSNIEVIIVDDGSTDPATLELLDGYDRPKTTVLRTGHHGLAASRNAGIQHSSGRYILPLDSDDMIGETYVEKAVKVLEADENIGIVYSDAEFFGEASGPWKLGPYGLHRILLTNMIFCTALFRRSDWERAGGYNRNMQSGMEDHDFWLSLIELGRQVSIIPETLFFYRRHGDSMTAISTYESDLQSYAQLVWNHPRLYLTNIGGMLRLLVAMGPDRTRFRKVIGVILQLTFIATRQAWGRFQNVLHRALIPPWDG